MGKSSAPPAPDYTGAAKQTAEGNIDYARATTQANRVNSYTPFGSLTYSQPNKKFDQSGYDQAMSAYQQQLNGTPGTGGQTSVVQTGPEDFDYRTGPGQAGTPGNPNAVAPDASKYWSGMDDWSSQVTLSPQMQGLLDQQIATSQQLAGLQHGAADRVDAGLNSPLPTAYNPEQSSNKAYELMMQRMQPDIDRDREAMHTRLSNMGLTNGSEAYNNDYRQEESKVNDARIAAQLASMEEGRKDQSQTFAQDTALRQMPLNELNALRSGSQMTYPTFPSPGGQQGQVGGPNFTNAATQAYQAAMNGFNVNQANDASTQQAAGSAASLAMLALLA